MFIPLRWHDYDYYLSHHCLPIIERWKLHVVIEVNIKRRQLNEFQIADLGYKLEEVEGEQAKKRKDRLIWLEL